MNSVIISYYSTRFAEPEGHRSRGWILSYSFCPGFAAQDGVESCELQAIASRQMDQMRIRNILAAGYRGQRAGASSVADKPMRAHPHYPFEGRDRILERAPKAGLRLTLRKPISLTELAANDFALLSHRLALT
jgi:hypothetical protein